MTLDEIVQRALDEDIGTGDATSELCVPADRQATGRFITREPIVVAGVEVLPLLYEDPDLKVKSGTMLEARGEIAFVRGNARALLSRERVALNFLQHLSGIATLARKYVDAVKGTGCKILDTRKTTPGLRKLEKMATLAGGVTNHRMGLFDAVLIKNNHITAAGGVRIAREERATVGPPATGVSTMSTLHHRTGRGPRAGATEILDQAHPIAVVLPHHVGLQPHRPTIRQEINR